MKASIFSFLLLFCSAKSDYTIPCLFKDGSFGKCVDIASCSELLIPFRQGTLKREDIPICDPVRRLVCCSRISAKKCKVYGRNALEIARIPSLLLIDEFHEIVIKTKCSHIPASLIVGGEEAKLHEFPHQALLGFQKNDTIQWLCGGSLISPDFVLTAAHCINLDQLGVIKYVKLGMHDLGFDGNKTVLHTVEKTFRHPRGDFSTSHIDIALLRLQSSVKMNEFVFAACLPTRPFYNDNAIVTGFGHTGKGVQSQKLLKVGIERFDQQICKDIYERRYNQETMLCYGHQTESKDACAVSLNFYELFKAMLNT
ncbi:hypothetical protein ACKWTF_001058 [Chironomus riparius]